MKIGLWTDSHYSTALCTCGRRYNSASLEKIERALQYFAGQQCDLVICLGDLIDREESHAQERINLQKTAALLDASGLPVICVMGNHDAFAFTPEEFYAVLGFGRKPETMHRAGRNLVFLDACYFRTGIHYAPGDEDWTDTFYPHAAALEMQLRDMSGDVYVFIHQNIDGGISEDHCLSNAADIRRILEQSGTVRAVYQGHYHPGFASESSGVRYVTLPAMCENEDAVYVIDI